MARNLSSANVRLVYTESQYVKPGLTVQAAKLREAFEANRNIVGGPCSPIAQSCQVHYAHTQLLLQTEARHIRGVITRGEEELWKQTHPDPYIGTASAAGTCSVPASC